MANAGNSSEKLVNAERLLFFSDAVVAIAITLLAIELPIPDGATVSEFWKSIEADSNHYLAFVVSFLVIGISWVNHHRSMSWLKSTDSLLIKMNFLWLFFIVLIPVATQLLAMPDSHDDTLQAFKWGIYALWQTLLTVSLMALTWRGLGPEFSEGAPTDERNAVVRGGLGVAIGFGISIPMFFVFPYAWIFWIVVPVVVGKMKLAPSR